MEFSHQKRRISERKNINILIVGESGIGKTTCINSIPHYLRNKILKDAIKKQPIDILIPTHFTYNTKTKDGELKINEIKIGESENENFELGESHTLKPKAYCFEYKDEYFIRIIDTPGIGDHRGIIQDKKNMQETIDYISELTHLNLIVFLLPPDQATLSPTFDFCFKELIMQFHRNASENIVFAFTRSSSCNYAIGQTLVPLQKLLSEIKDKQGIDIKVTTRNSFAFDNVAFRYICAYDKKTKSAFGEKNTKIYEKSFKISRKELIRLIDYAIQVKPHDPKYTAILNYTRNVILRLAGPMAMIATSIAKTLQNIQVLEDDILKYQSEESDLKESLFRSIIVVRYKIVRKERVYCRNCSKLERYYGDDRIPFIAADPGLADQDPLELWRALDAELGDDGEYFCRKCGPDSHILRRSNKVFHEFEENEKRMDTVVLSKLDGVKKTREILAAKTLELRKFQTEIQKEREKIIKASAKFAAYLKTSSIVPYNDVTENYLAVLIDLEIKKNGGKSEHCKNLEEMKKEYQAEKRILDENLSNAKDANEEFISPEEINTLIEELAQLKHYGKDIRDAFTVIKDDDGNDDDENVDVNCGGQKFSILQTPKFLVKLLSKLKIF